MDDPLGCDWVSVERRRQSHNWHVLADVSLALHTIVAIRSLDSRSESLFKKSTRFIFRPRSRSHTPPKGS